MSARLWMKMTFAGLGMCVGGPALVYYVTPNPDELQQRFNPELRRRSQENAGQKQQDFNHFVGKLKEYSKSDKTIWAAAEEDEARTRQKYRLQAEQLKQQQLAQQNEIKNQSLR